MAFGVSQAKLAMEDVDLAVQKRTQALVDLGEVVPVEKLGQGPHADELDRGVAGQVGERLVDADDRLGALTVGRHDRHADGGVLEAEPEALLGCADGLLGEVAVGDVAGRRVDELMPVIGL